MVIHFSGQTVFSFIHIEEITLGAGEEVDKVAGGASGEQQRGLPTHRHILEVQRRIRDIF